jgi:hypothetical protein
MAFSQINWGERHLIAGLATPYRGRPRMILNPLRMYRRRQRLERQALEEAQLLRRRHGDAAYLAALEKLRRPDLTWWGRKVVRRAIELLREQP